MHECPVSKTPAVNILTHDLCAAGAECMMDIVDVSCNAFVDYTFTYVLSIHLKMF